MLDKCWTSNERNATKIFSNLQVCFKTQTSRALERILQKDILDISDGVQLVKYKKEDENSSG